MAIEYIVIPAAILRLKDLNLRQKLLLALVVAFDGKGFRMSNQAIGEILGILPSRVTELFADLESKGYVEIKNRKSRYRTIYFRRNPKVGSNLLSTKSESKSVLLSTLDGSTFDESRNITKEELKKCAPKAKKPLCDKSFQRFWESYPKKQGKLDAQRAWGKLKPDTGLAEQIVKDVERRSRTVDWLKDGGKYVPMPTSYLSGRRWEDELPEPKRGDSGWLPTEEEAETIMRECGML